MSLVPAKGQDLKCMISASQKKDVKSVSSAHFADEETEAHTQGHTTIRAELGFDLLS